MSTSCCVGILNSDGSVESIWIWFDGYIMNEGVGQKLLFNFTDEESVRLLMSQGNRRSLFSPTSKDSSKFESTFSCKSKNVSTFLNRLNTTEYGYIFNPITKQWFVNHDGEGNKFFPMKRLSTVVYNLGSLEFMRNR